MKKVGIIFFITILIIFFAGCSGDNTSKDNNNNKKEEKKAEQKKGEEKPGKEGKKNGKKDGKDKDEETDTIPVSVKSPERGDINSFLLFSSNIDSEKLADIYPLSSGIVEKINFDEGDRVKKGSILAVLDDRDATINEKRAKISYLQQDAEFKRQKEIYEKELVSREEYERLKFNLEKSRLDWEQARLLLSYTRIFSPIPGLVSKRHIKIGNKINTNQLAFSVVYTKEKIAVLNIPEQEKDQIFLNQKAIISAGNKVLNGYIKRISPAIDPESGTFKTTVEVKDIKNIMVVGQFVNVKIIKKVHKDVILVTKEVLMFEGDRVFVFIIEKDDLAFKKEVKTGFDDGNRVEITEGITIDSKLVSAGKNSLKNKSKVKIIEPVI
ncbi:MAG: efflux RND transporter periplasmic adaptor subunit [Acidobacteriota bacterium]